MYKMIKVYNIQEEQKVVKSADYSVICEFEKFRYNDETKEMLLSQLKDNNHEYGNYTIVKYKGDEPIEIIGQLFYHSPQEEIDSWMDVAEWDERVVASAALGYDLTLNRRYEGHVKCFNHKKGYGFIVDAEGNDVFFHHSNLHTKPQYQLREGDIVEYSLGGEKEGKREQAEAVIPLVIRELVERELNKKNLYLKAIKDRWGVEKYLVIDSNDCIQTSEQGIYLFELALACGVIPIGREEDWKEYDVRTEENTEECYCEDMGGNN